MGATHKTNEGLGYHRILSLRLGDGQTTVGTCPSDTFASLVEEAVTTTADPAATAKALVGLDYRSNVARWYAITILVEAGAALEVVGLVPEQRRKRAIETDPVSHLATKIMHVGLMGIDPSEPYTVRLP